MDRNNGAAADPRVPFAFYLLALLLGVALRVFFVRPFGGVDFGNAVHAHSHTLYFGWAGLGILSLAFARMGAGDRVVRLVVRSLAVVSALTFAAFLEGGYGPPGIAVSTAALVVWAAAAIVFLRRARGIRSIDVSFLRAAMGYVALASVGACARVALLAAGVRDPLPGRLAVFAFLHDFAWFFVLAAFGLLAWLAPRLGTRLDERLLRAQLLLTVPFAWLTFPLGVAGGAAGWLGAIARVAAIALLVPAALGCANLWRAARRAARGGAALRWLAIWFGLQAAMEAAGALGLAEVALRSRHLAIAYLHVLLVGFVSGALALALLAARGAAPGVAAWWHNLGLAAMVAGLGAAGGGVVGLDAVAAPGLWLAAAGGLAIAIGGALWLAAAHRAVGGAGAGRASAARAGWSHADPLAAPDPGPRGVRG